MATSKNKPQSSIKKPVQGRKYFFDVLIFICSCLLFANTIPNNYSMDDELVTIDHRLTSKGISGIPDIISSPYYQDQSGYSYDYRPVVHITFAVEHEVFGDNPHVSHFWNVLLYALACVVLYRTLLLLFAGISPLIPVAIALLFAAHPAHTEVVASIKNRDEILGLLFCLLSLYSAVRLFIKGTGRSDLKEIFSPRSLAGCILVPVFYALALFSKITFAPFALVIILAVLFFSRYDFARLLYLVVCLGICAVSIAHIGDLTTRVFLLSMAVAGVGLLYIARHWPQIAAVCRTAVRSLIRRGADPVADPAPAGLQASFFQIPASPLFITSALLMVGLLLIFAWASFLHFMAIQLIVVICFIPFLFVRHEAIRQLGVIGLFILFSIYKYVDPAFVALYLDKVFVLVLVYFGLYTWRTLPLLSALAVLCMLALHIASGHDKPEMLIDIVLMIFAFYVQRYRYGWLIMGMAITGLLWSLYASPSLAITYIVTTLATSALLLLVYFKGPHLIVARIYLIAMVFMLLSVNPGMSRDRAIVNNTVATISRVSPHVISKTDDRPITYAENCIDFVKTPQHIKLGTSLEILGHYLVKVICPYPLAFYYGYKYIVPMSVGDAIPMMSLLAHLALIVLGLYFWSRDRRISFGILVYLCFVVAYSNYLQPVPGMIADRFLLIPSLGWAIISVLLMQRFLVRDLPPRATSISSIPPIPRYAFIAIVLLYSVVTVLRNRDWKDYLTLYRHDIQYVSNSAQANNMLAIRLMRESYDYPPPVQQQMREEAVGHLITAADIAPTFFNPTYDVARVYEILGKPDSALIYYDKASKINPGFFSIYLAAGEIYFRQGRLDQAREQFRRVMTADSGEYVGYDKVGYTYFLQKNYPKALEVTRIATEKFAQNPNPRVAMARIYHEMERNDSARYWLERALELNPAQQDARILLQTLQPK